MKTSIRLVALMVLILFFAFVGKENQKKESEKVKALETVKAFASFAKKNHIGFEHQVIDKRNSKVQYQIDFVSAEQGVNLKIRQKNYRGDDFKMHFVYTDLTDWYNLVVVSDRWKECEIKERQSVGKDARYILRGDLAAAFWRELNHHLTSIMEAKEDSNFVFQRKKLNTSRENKFEMDEDFILNRMLNPEDD